MLRRKAIEKLLLAGGSIAVLGSSAVGWKYSQVRKTPDWHSFQNQRDLLADLTEAILPTTNTIGAKAAGVPDFVEHMVRNGLDVKSQNNFIDGLNDVSEYCESTFGKTFAHTTASERVLILAHFKNKTRSLSAVVSKVQNFLMGKPFFAVLRDLTIIGYCTSESGVNQSLAYDYVPGQFIGCLPYTEGQKSWATQ